MIKRWSPFQETPAGDDKSSPQPPPKGAFMNKFPINRDRLVAISPQSGISLCSTSEGIIVK